MQKGILEPVPPHARYLTFSLAPGADPRPALTGLVSVADGAGVVAGIGLEVVSALKKEIRGLRSFPALAGAGVSVPSTPGGLWCWIRGADRGQILHAARKVRRAVSGAFVETSDIEAFRYGTGLDLTGYEDGTENPVGEKAVSAAIVSECGAGLDGSSFVAVQQWVHDLDRFDSMASDDQDKSIGRRRADNEEMADAPPSAHVKRSAQESFTPQAFVLRRSMPWSGSGAEGLVFVAFGASFDSFESILRRMIGEEDGTVDALFNFTRPVSGAYYWCPPMESGRLDLRTLGVG